MFVKRTRKNKDKQQTHKLADRHQQVADGVCASSFQPSTQPTTLQPAATTQVG